MNIIKLNPKFGDTERREYLFNGDFIVYSSIAALQNLVQHAQSFIKDSFGEEAEKAQYTMEVDDFIALASPLKTKFTNDQKTKELIREILRAFGCDLEKTYFDVPRIRIVTSDNFLTAGVGYAYKAHRDTWYSSPESQINWWMPVFDLTEGNTMSMYPGYWENPIKNSSKDFNYEEWCTIGRTLATTQKGVDTRKHPLPLETVSATTETRFVLSSAEIMLFSASHLHATAPNTSSKTRFSIDFRTVHLDDLLQGKGAKNIDNESTGTTLQDFFRASDFEKIGAELVHSYSL